MALGKVLRSGFYAGQNRFRMMCSGARICTKLKWFRIMCSEAGICTELKWFRIIY
jgi:hypothetical protein